MKKLYRQILSGILMTFLFHAQAQIFQATQSSDAYLNFDPDAIKVIDLNQDGIDEVLTQYKFSTDFPATSYIDQLEAGYYGTATLGFGDFNEDGYLDMVNSNVMISFSNTTKTFGDIDFYDFPITTHNTTGVGNVLLLSIGDLNNDDNLDVLAYQLDVTFSVYRLYFYAGDGQGDLADPVNVGFPLNGLTKTDMKTADFNGDGTPDLVLSALQNGNSLSGTYIYPGSGDGTFDLENPIFFDALRGTLKLADINNDTRQDLLIDRGDTLFSVMNMNTAAPQINNLGIRLGTNLFNLGDFNGDGNLDIVESQLPLTFYLGDGNGLFGESPERHFDPLFGNGGVLLPLNKNGDGVSDLFYYNTTVGKSYISLSNSLDGAYENLIHGYEVRNISPEDALIADLNSDGYDDYAYLVRDSLVIQLSAGDGSWKLEESIYYETSENPTVIHEIDIENDNDIDLIIGANDSGNNNIQLFTNNGDGTFASPANTVAQGVSDITVADFNNDQLPDVAIKFLTVSDVGILLNSGNGGFSTLQSISTSVSGSGFIESGDFNNDTFVDIMIKRGNRLNLMQGDGSGSFIYDSDQNLDITGIGGNEMVTEDFNDDEIVDILVTEDIFNSLSYRYVCLLGVENASLNEFPVSYSYGLSRDSERIVSVDLNEDGLVDIVSEIDGGRFNYGLSNGDGTFEIREHTFSKNTSSSLSGPIAGGDINGDDKNDLIIASTNLGRSVQYMLLNEFEGADEPSLGPSSVNVVKITSDSATVKWTNGDGSGVLVLVSTDPVDQVVPKDFDIVQIKSSKLYPFAASIIDGANVVYDGEADSVILTNLPINTTFNVVAFSYNGTDIDRNYLESSPAIGSFTTLKGDQVVTITEPEQRAFRYAAFSPAHTINSQLETTLAIISGPAIVNAEGEIELTGLGELIYSISQSGDDDWNELMAVKDTIDIINGNQIINFNLSASTFIQEEDLMLPVYSTNDLPISYSIDSGAGSLRISGDTTFYVWDGETSLTITASQDGNELVNAAVPVSRSTTVSKQDQVISWQPSEFVSESGSTITSFLDNKTIQFTLDTLALNATSSVGLPVTFIISNGGPGFLKGTGDDSRFYIYNSNSVGTGNVAISAAAQGNDVYNTSIPVEISFTIIKGRQTISFQQDFPNAVYGDGLSYKLEATSSAQLDISYSLNSGVGTIEEDSIHVTQAGSFSITAIQEGNDNWESAQSVTRQFTVSRAEQTITFEQIEDKIKGDDPFDLIASATSGLDLQILSTTGRTSINGNQITINENAQAGLETLRITQSGNVNYSPANLVELQFCISPKKPIISELSEGMLQVDNLVDGIEWYLDGTLISTTGGGVGSIPTSGSGVYTAIAMAQGGCSDSEESDPLDKILSLNQEHMISLYPNPILNELNIDLGRYLELELTIVNASGQKMLSSKLKNQHNTISLHELVSGVYLIHLQGKDFNIYQTIVKLD